MTTDGPARSAGVRHDLGHQLAALHALLDLAADTGGSAAGRAAALRTARSEIGHAQDLVAELGGPTPGDAGPPVGTDLTPVLHAAAAAHPTRGVEVRAGGPARVGLDGTSATRVVRNLLGNALAAVGPGGRVVLAATGTGSAEGAVLLTVDDDGPGPGPAGFLRPGGTGLDLVRALVLPVGGSLLLGRSPLGGARVEVELPSRPAPGAPR